MTKIPKLLSIFILTSTLLLLSCSKVRESAGVTRKFIDEFQAVENPPLIIPPDFNLLPPEQLEQKNIEDLEKDFAKEILFGLEEEQNINEESSTMSTILDKTKATNISDQIREDIDREFAQETKSNNIFQMTWENENEVLDAVGESECIREKNFKGESIADCETSVKIEKTKIKKKKRFWIF